MNAAARLVHKKALARPVLLAQAWTWTQVASLCLSLVVIVSAVATIYITHTTREVYAAYQSQVNEKHRLQMVQRQLLLERSTLLVQARAQEKVHDQLGMVEPDEHSTVMIHE